MNKWSLSKNLPHPLNILTSITFRVVHMYFYTLCSLCTFLQLQVSYRYIKIRRPVSRAVFKLFNLTFEMLVKIDQVWSKEMWKGHFRNFNFNACMYFNVVYYHPLFILLNIILGFQTGFLLHRTIKSLKNFSGRREIRLHQNSIEFRFYNCSTKLQSA